MKLSDRTRALLRWKPNPLMMETKMSDYVQLHKPACLRAIDAYKKAVATIFNQVEQINTLEAKAAEDKVTIEALTFALNETFPEDVGGSMGGITG